MRRERALAVAARGNCVVEFGNALPLANDGVLELADQLLVLG